MQDSCQNGEAMHKGIMLSGQTVDNAADSVPESDNMQYVNLWEGTRIPKSMTCSPMFRQTSAQSPANQPDPLSHHTAPINAPQANSTPLPAIVESK